VKREWWDPKDGPKESSMADDWDLADATADDIFEAAMAIEQGGIDFYERLRSSQADPRVKKELEFLRDEEARHKELFRSFLRARPAGARGDAPTRLQALVHREFIDPLQKLFQSSRIETNYETIGFGQELEKKSMSFYRSLLPSADEKRRADIERIIAEEQRHLEQLQLLRAYY
jgi:rubrerythrin